MHGFRGIDNVCMHLNPDGSRCQMTYLEHIDWEPEQGLPYAKQDMVITPYPEKNEWWRVNYWWFDITSWLCDKGIRKCKTCRENDQYA